jgi:ribosomal protein S18 acetylase RimI-like enzyme
MVTIRRASNDDFEAILSITHEAFGAGDTYPYPPGTSTDDVYHTWMEVPAATFVALDGDEVVGTYYIKSNQPGLGSHVCNCGYIVKSSARGRGVGRAMCENSQDEARRLGFKAMQFNLVVSTNEAAVKLWRDLGFEIVGRLPRAFAHQRFGLVDAFVMYKWLEEEVKNGADVAGDRL